MDNQARWALSDSLDSSAFPCVHQTKNSEGEEEEEEEEEETMKKIRRKDRKETETDAER